MSYPLSTSYQYHLSNLLSEESPPVAVKKQVPFSSSEIVEKIKNTSIPGLKQEFVETLITVSEMSELQDISTSISKLLLNTMKIQVQKNKLIDMFSKVQNIVDVKLVHDRLGALCKVQTVDKVKEKQTCYSEFKCIIKEIERKVFCGVDIFGIATDTAGLTETLIKRILTDSVDSLKRWDAGVEHLRGIMYELIEALHLQEDVTNATSGGDLDDVDGWL